MKILCVADTVVNDLLQPDFARQLQPDCIIGCGDLPPEYLSRLRSLFDTPLYYVLGNHDLRYSEAPPGGCLHLDRRLVKENGLSLIGFSGSRWYNGGKYQLHEKQMAKNVKRMRFTLWRNGSLDIVATHAPPRFINDAEDPCHRGFRIYRYLIEKYRPRFFLHGHIHRQFSDDSMRITELGGTKIINCYGYYVLHV